MEGKRKYIEAPDPDHQYPWVIWSRMDHLTSDCVFVERMDSQERAMQLGHQRHEQGYVVSVFYEIAHTEG